MDKSEDLTLKQRVEQLARPSPAPRKDMTRVPSRASR